MTPEPQVPSSPPSAPSERPTGARPLGAWVLFALGVNGIVGAGIFFTPPLVAASVPGVLGALVYPVVALGCLPIALCYARLARVLPLDGGPAMYAAKAFGPRVARAVGSIVWVGALFSVAALTRALAEKLAPLLPWSRSADVWTVVLCLGLLVLNLSGVKLASRVWTVLTVLKLLPLVAIIGIAIPRLVHGLPPAAPLAPSATQASAASLSVLFALQGFEVVPLMAGQVTAASSVVPRATLASLGFASGLYAGLHLACVLALPSLATSQSPLPETAAILGGQTLAGLVEFGVLVSIAGLAVAMHATTPRYFLATTGDVPEGSRLRWTFVLHAVVIAVLAWFSSLKALVENSSIAVLAQYASTACALLVLARRRAFGLRPWDASIVPLALGLVVVLLSRANRGQVILAATIAALAHVIGEGASWLRARTSEPGPAK